MPETQYNPSCYSSTRTYRCWTAMCKRCRNPNCRHYPDYGGRGIKVCAALQSSKTFLAIMGEAPDGMTIDRKDNDGHYSCGACGECLDNKWPMNIRWATMREQQNNRRDNHRLEYNGESHTIAEWSRITGINPPRLRMRIVKYRWSVGEALGFEPCAPRGRWVNYSKLTT